AFEAALAASGDALPDAARLAAIVQRKLSREALWRAARAYDRGRTAELPVDELIAFALDCWPEAARTPLYRSVQLRRRIGPRYVPYLQPLVLSAVLRK